MNYIPLISQHGCLGSCRSKNRTVNRHMSKTEGTTKLDDPTNSQKETYCS